MPGTASRAASPRRSARMWSRVQVPAASPPIDGEDHKRGHGDGDGRVADEPREERGRLRNGYRGRLDTWHRQEERPAQGATDWNERDRRKEPQGRGRAG